MRAKSLDVGKAIDKAAGAERETIREGANGAGTTTVSSLGDGLNVNFQARPITAPATDAAQQWDGWGTALKPAWEIVVSATKPVALVDRIGSHLDELETTCRRLASDAERSSEPTHHDSPAVKTGSVPGNAATPHEDAAENGTGTGKGAGSFVQTDTSASEWMAETCSSIVSSWKECLAALCEPTNTSTTETILSTTTDLTTLWSCLSQITHPSTILDPTSPDGLSSLARAADNLFGAAVLSTNAIRTLTATAPATSPTQPTSQDAPVQLEPIVVARKPLAGTVAQNVTTWGCGALNIDATRIGTDTARGDRYNGKPPGGSHSMQIAGPRDDAWSTPTGRWPANVVLDEAAAARLDQQSGESVTPRTVTRGASLAGKDGATARSGGAMERREDVPRHGDSGGASRFFKVVESDRFRYTAKADSGERVTADGVNHPTVKPLDLMQWLIRLVTPPNGLILDPFAGSGTTGEAAVLEGFRATLIEQDATYLPLIEARVTRQRDPVRHLQITGGDLGLFGLDDN